MPSLRPKGGGDNPFARARGASPPPPPVTRFLNNLNKITISATEMNNDDPLSYLPVSRCVDVEKSPQNNFRPQGRGSRIGRPIIKAQSTLSVHNEDLSTVNIR